MKFLVTEKERAASHKEIKDVRDRMMEIKK
jgi:hypothetical protein